MQTGRSEYRTRGKPHRAMAEIRRMLLQKISIRINQERATKNILKEQLTDSVVQNPVQPNSGSPRRAMKIQIDRSSHDRQGPRILVIEDDSGLSEVLSLVLKSGQMDHCIAETGSEALGLLEGQNFDLILSDVDLPDMNCFEICRRIKQNPSLQRVPIILMSGRPVEENEGRALKLGAAEYLSKPFQATSILKKILTHIQRAQNAT
jgi:CheY-like chemotaxis protein